MELAVVVRCAEAGLRPGSHREAARAAEGERVRVAPALRDERVDHRRASSTLPRSSRALARALRNETAPESPRSPDGLERLLPARAAARGRPRARAGGPR